MFRYEFGIVWHSKLVVLFMFLVVIVIVIVLSACILNSCFVSLVHHHLSSTTVQVLGHHRGFPDVVKCDIDR